MEEQIVQGEISSKILTLRDQQMMLDRDLAELYGVEMKVFNQAVKRNSKRFPSDFMFQVSEIEYENLRSQIVTSSSKHGGRRYMPSGTLEASRADMEVTRRLKGIELLDHAILAKDGFYSFSDEGLL